VTASHANRSLPTSTTDARRVALIVAAAYFMQNLDGTITMFRRVYVAPTGWRSPTFALPSLWLV
jgi:hypothetical protein